MESRRQLGKFEDDLKFERGISERINFDTMRVELINDTTYLFVECSEEDVDDITEQMSVENNEFINLVESEKNGSDSFVKYSIPGITSELDREDR